MAEDKIKKQAAKLQQLINENKVLEADVPQLVTHGLDIKVVEYWAWSKIIDEVRNRLKE